MKFITFQPKNVEYELSKNGAYNAPKNETLMNKIFALKLDGNIMERIYMCAPSMPQIGIIFESDDYAELDSVEWVNKLHVGIDKKLNTKYKEYTLDKIESEKVIKIINISDSNDPDEVQDDFMDKHFMQLEKLSGYKWDRICDRPDLAGTYEANKLCMNMMRIMTPFEEVTEQEFDDTAELLRTLYRKHEIKKISVDDIK